VESPCAAADQIRIEQLEVFARVGITENERANPQRLTLTITIWPNRQFGSLQDDIANTINYSAICVTARNFTETRSDKLVETLASELATELLRGFAISKVQIELRKFVLPDAQYAAVVVTRPN
jgi:dihydroneopterin aldolase